MNPITRATIKSFCRICLESIEDKEHNCKNIEGDDNLYKWSQQVIPISIQSLYPAAEAANDSNTKLICSLCYVKISTFYDFYERSFCSAGALKLLLEEDRNSLTEQQLMKLKSFCRTCLKRQSGTVKLQKVQDLKDLLREGTRVDIDDAIKQPFPELLCQMCCRKLKSFNEFQRIAFQSFAYLKEVIGTEVTDDVQQHTKEEVIESIFIKEANEEYKEREESFNDDEMSNECHLANVFEYRCLEGDTISYIIEEEPINCKNDERIIEKPEDMGSPEGLDMTAHKNKPDLMEQLYLDEIIESSTVQANYSREQFEAEDGKSFSSSRYADSDFECTTKKVKSKNSRRCKRQNKTNFKCEECNKKFHKKERYEDHIVGSHGRNTNTRQCSTCLKTFKTIATLERHIKTIHDPLSVKEFTCSYCCKPFACKDHMQAHVRSVHLKARPFKCKTCDKAFGAANTLRRHEMIHTANYPFKCEICDWAFRQRSQLNLHMQSHNANPELMCPICKRAKNSLEELEAHKAHHHMKKQCFKCGKIFSKTAHLREHDMTVHLKLRPYKCSMCEKAFGKPYDCQQHELTHRNERTEICEICHKAFKNPLALRRHKRRHTKFEQETVQIAPDDNLDGELEND